MLKHIWYTGVLFGMIVMAHASSVYAQDKRLPTSEPIGLPPAPKEIKLPPAPKEIKLPPAPQEINLPPPSEFKKLPGEDEPNNLPPAPTLTDKFPGNQVIVIGENDPRIRVDLDVLPWRAIGRIKAKGGSCTGALIGPSLLLTAAHCVFDSRSRQYFAPKDLRFFLGYSEGKFSAQAKGANLIVPDDYDPILNIGTMSKDWALIELDKPIGTPETILPMLDKTPGAGATAALGGYANDMIENLMADPKCAVLGLMFDVNDMPLIRHNCAATQGVSGAPLLIQHGGEWVIGGIEVVGSSNGIGGAAVLHEVQAAIAKMPNNPLFD